MGTLFSEIDGQQRAGALLAADLASGRLAHAYLFAGPDGVGRLAMAQAFARVVLCADRAPGEPSCGRCRSCRLMDHEQHPDYHEVGVPDGKQDFPISVVREEVQDKAAIKPLEAGRRVFVLRQVERVTTEAANCMLKTLEEPPGACLLILIASSLWDVPPTIISRCRLVRFGGLPAGHVADGLEEGGLLRRDADWLARRAWGSPGRADEFREAGLHEFNRQLTDLMANMTPDDGLSLGDWLSVQVGDAKGAQARAWLLELLECIAVFYRDVAVEAAAPGSVELFNEASRERIAEVARRCGPDGAVACAERVFEAMERIGGNAGRLLALDDMFTWLVRKTARSA